MTNSPTSSDQDDLPKAGNQINDPAGHPTHPHHPNPFTKGRLAGAKNYNSSENFVIIEAIGRRKAHYSWRDENIWRAVAMEVSNSTTHERTPVQISDHFKKMVTATRIAISELYVSTKLGWPPRGSLDDEETLQAERVMYISHLLNLMIGKGSSKKFYSRNWWSESVLLRLVELIHSDDGRDYGIGDFSDMHYENDPSRRQSIPPNARSGHSSPLSKRKRDEDDEDMQTGRSRTELLEDALVQVNYTKIVADNLAHSLNSTNDHVKILESKLKALEDSNIDLKREIRQLHDVIQSFVMKQGMDSLM